MTAFFVAIVLGMLGWWTWLFGRRVGIVLAALLVVAWIAAYAGLFRFGPQPPPLLFALAPAVAATVLLALRAPLAGVSIVALIGFQVMRVAVEVFLWWGHREGIVPGQMTWEGRNFDVLTGLTAPLVAWLAARGQAPRWLLQVWNLAGFGLLVNIVSVAMLSMPTPLQRFQPANTFVAEAPFIWLPMFLVQSALFGHIALWRKLSLARGRAL